MKVKILDDRVTPDMLGYKTKGSAAIDLYALPDRKLYANYIFGGRYTEFKTGIAIEVPEGFVGLIVPRSSTGSSGINLANSTGVIDSDYRGEILLRLISWSPTKEIVIKEPTRVAQLLIMPVEQVDIEIVEELSETDRGGNGFGSTGTK